MRTLIFLVSFLLSGHLLAQAPGYLGKKLVASYDPHISFSLYDEEINNDDGVPYMGINLRHDLYADYVISRGTTLGLTAKFMGAKMYDVSQVIDEVYNADEGTYEFVGFNGDLKDRITCIGITAKNFSYRKRGSIAPVGKYKSFELMMVFQKLVEKDLKDYGEETPGSEGSFSKLVHFEDIPGNHEIDIDPTAAFIFGFGRQSVYGEGITVNMGWEIGLSLSPYIFDAINERGHIRVYDSSDYEDIAGGRLAGAILLSFNVGIGYILM